MLNNIPFEMQAYPNWIVWRLEWQKDDTERKLKPTKMPYSTKTLRKADTTNSQDWTTFNEARALPLNSQAPVEWNSPVRDTGFTGVGFVFAHNAPFAGIDLDDAHGDAKAFADQQDIYRQFDSYTEMSPSGNGVHIIVKGQLPQGRRRFFVEIYSSGRFFTMTGNVINPKPIAERQALLTMLFEHMGGKSAVAVIGEDQPEVESDSEIIRKASAAINGSKFTDLYEGDHRKHYGPEHGHDGEGLSEADFALINIVAFYTQNKRQIARIFHSSKLGKREKAKRAGYINYMVERSFDRQLPKIDIEALKIEFAAMMAARAGVAVQPGGSPATPQSAPIDKPTSETDNATYHDQEDTPTIFPPGLLGEVAQFILDAAPRPVPVIALAGAIALLSGVTGRAYNVNGMGLNQYIIMLAGTGIGKDAIRDGISKLMNAVKVRVPNAGDFQGPGVLISSAGLIKWVRNKPACFSVIGEIGEKLKDMSAPNANANLTGLRTALTELYTVSGAGKVLDPSAYSDSDKNGTQVYSPSYTLIGESVPGSFYEGVSEELVSSGLVPRFMLFEYLGKRGYVRENLQDVKPSVQIIDKMAALAANCLSLAHNNNVHDVVIDSKSRALFTEFDIWTTDLMNEDNRRVTVELWNRAHIKALKLAAVCAIGINYINPIITEHETMWATNMIVAQTKKLLGKFERGEVGAISGDEIRQTECVISAIKSYMTSKFERYAIYGGSEQMHGQKIITHDHISRRVGTSAAFRRDKFGPSNALKRTMVNLIDAGDIAEINKQQMQSQFGKACKAYCIIDPRKFM